MEEEIYGIDKDHAHKRAIELIPEEFFWDCVDEQNKPLIQLANRPSENMGRISWELGLQR